VLRLIGDQADPSPARGDFGGQLVRQQIGSDRPADASAYDDDLFHDLHLLRPAARARLEFRQSRWLPSSPGLFHHTVPL